MVDDWIAHTPVEVLAKNFGVNASVFSTIPTTDPYILNGTVSTSAVAAVGLVGNSSYVFHASQNHTLPVPGGGGTLSIIDSRNFPISTTIAATVVTLFPGGLRLVNNVCFGSRLTQNAVSYTGIRMPKSGCTSPAEPREQPSSLGRPVPENSTSALEIPQYSHTTAGITSRTHLLPKIWRGLGSTSQIVLLIYLWRSGWLWHLLILWLIPWKSLSLWCWNWTSKSSWLRGIEIWSCNMKWGEVKIRI